jgi:NADPH2:quinone reductase
MLLKNCAVSGVFWGEFARREPEKNRKNMALLMDWLKMGKIQPYISARYGLKDVSCALQDMLDRKVLGKLIIEFI